MPELELEEQLGTALLNHRGCWDYCYCCCCCLFPSWQTGHEGELLLEKVRKVLGIAFSLLKVNQSKKKQGLLNSDA